RRLITLHLRGPNQAPCTCLIQNCFTLSYRFSLRIANMEVKLRFPETPKFSDDPASRFSDYYERYLIAKGQQNAEMIWLCAVSEVTAAPWPWLASKLSIAPNQYRQSKSPLA